MFVFSAIVAITLRAGAAEAQNYPWCAIYKGGAMNCGFMTFQQCLATVSEAGFCTQNNTYQPPQDQGQEHEEQDRHSGSRPQSLACLNSFTSFATLAAIRRALSGLAASLLVPAKYVPDAGSYGDHAQRLMCSQRFTDPQYILPQDVHLLRSNRFVPQD